MLEVMKFFGVLGVTCNTSDFRDDICLTFIMYQVI